VTNYNRKKKFRTLQQILKRNEQKRKKKKKTFGKCSFWK
jgi:hypothetical protein